MHLHVNCACAIGMSEHRHFVVSKWHCVRTSQNHSYIGKLPLLPVCRQMFCVSSSSVMALVGELC